MAKPSHEEKEINVQGMTCEQCVKHVTKALEKLPSIEQVKVSLENSQASFHYDPSQVTLVDIGTALEDAGYSMDKPENTPEDKETESAKPEDKEIGNTEKAVTAEQKQQFKISGMTCANCALTIEKGLKTMPGIKTAAVNFASEKLSVELDPNVVKEEEILAKIKDLGYGASTEGNEGKQRFKVSGMTCANCALTIEKKLKGTPGVQLATVNFANETVSVEFDPKATNMREIFEQVRDAGYIPLDNKADNQEDRTAIKQRNWLIFSAVLSLPIIPLMYLPMSQMQIYTMLILATIVQFTAGWTFYRGAYHSLKNRSANMDVLVALGITAAYGYSVMTTFPNIFFLQGPSFLIPPLC